MKLILSTLALGAAATSSALDLGGDTPQAGNPPHPLQPATAAQLPPEAPRAPTPVAPALPAASPAPVAGLAPPTPQAPPAGQPEVPFLSSIPTIDALLQDDDDLQESANELEKEIASLRKQLTKMRKELRKSDADQATRERAMEQAEVAAQLAEVRSREARERGTKARVRLEADVARSAEALARSEAARARGDEAMARAEVARVRGEYERSRAEVARARAARAEGQEAREEVRRRVIERRARADAPRPTRDRVRLIEEIESEDGVRQVIIMRDGEDVRAIAPRASRRFIGMDGSAGVGPKASGKRVTGIGIGGSGLQEVHEIHTMPGDHDAPHAGHGSTININVDEGDVHIHAGGAQIHTSKGANVLKMSSDRALFGMVRAPEGHEHEAHASSEHVHENGQHVVEIEGLRMNAPRVLEWTTSGPGEDAKTGTWTSGGDGPNVFKLKKKIQIGADENVFFFDDDGGDFEGTAENVFMFDGEDGPSKGRFIIKHGDGEAQTKHFEFPGGHGMVHVEVKVEDGDDGGDDGDQIERYRFQVGGETHEVSGGLFAIDGTDGEAYIKVQGALDSVDIQEILDSIDLEGIEVDLSEMNIGEIEFEDIGEEIEEAHEEAHEAIEEIEFEDEGGRVIRGRVLRKEAFEGDGDTFRFETDPQGRFTLDPATSKKGGKAKVRVRESTSPVEVKASNARTVDFTHAVNSPFGQPAGDEELMSAVRDIQDQLLAMRAELQELREAVLEAPRRTTRRAGFGGGVR